MLTCSTLRGAVLISAMLLIAGWVTGLVSGIGLVPTEMAAYPSLFLMLGAAAVLGLTFLLALLPFNARRLATCEH